MKTFNIVFAHFIRCAVFLGMAVFASNAFAEEALTLPEDVNDPHSMVFSEDGYPSASKCAPCHQQIYDEWASSNHAYASISPMFHKFEQAITNLTQGTIGTFCVRCHQQVGTQLGEKRYWALWERSQVAREGITCITCHRVAEAYGKVNGERNIVSGSIHMPVAGAMRDSVYDEAVEEKDELRIALDESERGTPIHQKPVKFEQIGKSEFCVSCHQVAVNLGIKLEVVWDQYRDSPAFKKGDTCQDCHMGKVPGVAAGYETGPSAVVNGVEINPGRRHSNHSFYGPGYPIAHPGIFPHNPEAEAWDMEEWLMFDYRAGWGTEDFEDRVYDINSAMNDLHYALEPLGGGQETLWGLDGLDRAAARGPQGFETDRAKERLTSKVEALEGIAYPDGVDDAIADAETALDTLEEAIEDAGYNGEVMAAVAKLRTAVAGLAGEAGALDEFDAAYEQVVASLETTFNTDASQADVDQLIERTNALRASLPAARADFVAAINAVKKPLGVNFPFIWADIGDREDAREIVDHNLVLLEEKRELRRQVMENGSRIDGPFFEGERQVGRDLDFKYVVHNIDEGHNLPSGSLGAQPEIWLNVALVDPDGKNVWESGYVDKNGDFADNHSLEVAAGTIPFDDQIFNLQSKFLTTNVKGTDREMYLPVNFDLDQRPFLRPANVPYTILNHAPFVRMEARSIPPLGSKDAEYSVPGELIKKAGDYKLAVRMRSRAEPIYFMRFVGATPEMEQSMNEWMLDIHPYTVEFAVGE